MTKVVFEILKIGIYLGYGAWNLVFILYVLHSNQRPE